MKRILFFLLGLLFAGVSAISAQPAFALPSANKMITNPAFTGIDTSFKNEASLYTKIVFNNKFSLSNNYGDSYTMAIYQMRLDKIKSGIGIMLNYNNYNAADYVIGNQAAAKLYYRYTILPGLSFGADAGFVNLKTTYDYTNLSPFGDPIVYTPYTKGTLNNNAFDGGLGVLYQLKSLYAGFSVDHITSPQGMYPGYSMDGKSIALGMPMLNYSGIAYNWIVGGHIGNKNEGMDISASYRDFNLDVNLSFILRHFFIGFSALVGNYYNDNIVPEAYSSANTYFALMGGINVYHKKIKVSFAYTFNGGAVTYVSTPIEAGISYSF